MKLKWQSSLLLGSTLIWGAHALAITLTDATQQAVLQNPEVQAKWREFNGANAQQDAARGGYYPRLDLNASTGRENLRQPGQATRDFNRQSYSATLTQLLFDGFATRSEVRRLGYAKLIRYYELLDVSENVAAEAARAYFDVLRYRDLVKLAEENYAQHRMIFDQMEQRVKAGVGRRVDFEQAGGRLALAESNLLTEITNLHDVSARYQRLVGTLPPEDMEPAPILKDGIPATTKDAVMQAFKNSPILNAAIENIRSAQMDLSGKNAPFMPKFELRAKQEHDRNLNGVIGNRENRVLEVVMNYNLFRGGTDMALKRQAAENLNGAKDLRDKTCRDLRQTLTIAYNDTQRIAEQLRYLNAHQLAAEKARDAYRKQFDIGQRSLLDLLDTENELFQARRAYVNAQNEYGIAHARTHAAMGNLLAVLKLRRLETPSLAEMGEDPFEVDPATACPPEAASMVKVDKDAVLARAMQNNPIPLTVQEVKPATPSDEEQVKKAVMDWAAAWSSKNSAAYLAFYFSGFDPGTMTRDKWVQQRKQRLSKPGDITVTVEDLKIRFAGKDEAIAEFRQVYRSADYQDVVNKTLHWQREAGRWVIRQEQSQK